MSECPHKQLKKQMVGEQIWYACECGQKFRVEPWDGRVRLVEGLKVEEVREPLNSDWPEREEFYDLMQQYRHAAVSVPSLVLDRYNAIKAWLRQQETAQTHEMVVRNLAMLVRRLIHRIRSKYKAPDDTVAKQAWDYLMGGGLQGSMLRKEAAQHLKREQEPAPRELRKTIIEELYKRHNGLSPQWIDDFADFVVRVAAQPPQELVSLDHKELASFFWRHAPVLWKDRWTCRCGKWALSRELNSIKQADESRSQHIAEAFLEWRAALTRGAVGGWWCTDRGYKVTADGARKAMGIE